MLKVPMQIYLDPEVISIYKEYAHASKISVSGLIRSAVENHVEEIKKKIEEREKLRTKERKAALQFLKEHAEKYKHLTYHHPEKSDDELLYGE